MVGRIGADQAEVYQDLDRLQERVIQVFGCWRCGVAARDRDDAALRSRIGSGASAVWPRLSLQRPPSEVG